MMLDQADPADAIVQATEIVIKTGDALTADIGGKATMAELARRSLVYLRCRDCLGAAEHQGRNESS